MNVEDLLSKVNFNLLNCEYADIRIEKTIDTLIKYEGDDLKQISESPALGAFLRVLVDGNWAYQSTTDLNHLNENLLSLCEKAKLLPKKQACSWPKRDAKHYEYNHFKNENCTQTSLEEKKIFCESLLPVLKNNPLLKGPVIVYKDMYKQKLFKAKDGVTFYYDYNQAGCRVSYTLNDGQNIFKDSCSLFFQNVKNQKDSAIQKLKKEIELSAPFLHAQTIIPGKYKVVLSPLVTGVFTHESFGHKSEADFMLGDEGMKNEWEIGKQVASPMISIVDDGNWPGTTGYLPIDDEGNLKEKTYLIKDGRLGGRLHSTSTAIALAENPTGNARAMNFQYEPIPRMTNTYIEKGDKSFNELISPIKEGIYIKDFKHGMGMSMFTIAPSRAYWIKNGKIAEPVRVSVISGNVLETLFLIEDIGEDFEIESSALGGCGKFSQWPLPVADGGPSIVVKEMTVS